MVFVSLSLVPLMYKPSSESHPFGYQQIESLFVVVKGAIMIAVTVGLIINNIQIIFHGGQHVNFSMVAYFEMSATLVSIAVIFLLRRMNSKLTSPIVIMEIQEWQIDSVASFGMCIAFFLPQIITGEWFQPLIPYLDPALAIILSLFMLPVPVKTVITGLRDLFLLLRRKKRFRRSKISYLRSLPHTGTQNYIMISCVLDGNYGSACISP